MRRLLASLLVCLGLASAARADGFGFPYVGPWVSASSTITAAAGTLTTSTGTVRSLQLGKALFLSYTISITNAGTGSAALIATMPAGAVVSSSAGCVLSGRDITTGKAIVAFVAAGASLVGIVFYDNTYPGATGAAITLTGVCEVN